VGAPILAEVERFFSPDGPLARVLPGYEERHEQLAMAMAVARAIRDQDKLLAEAGTGTGKTLAYLVPAVLSGKRVVISTATKNLQDQLMAQDIPLVARALGTAVDAQLMKGRSNYLCLARLLRVGAHPELPQTGRTAELEGVVAWAERTTTGDRAELEGLADDSPLWRDLSVTSEQCTGRACAQFERCFVTQMRRAAQASQICVVNHHLYFADLAVRSRRRDDATALLPGHDIVIFDEAHELEDIGAQHFGVSVSERRFADLADELCHPSRRLGKRAEQLGRELVSEARRLFDRLPFAAARQALGRKDVAGELRAQHAALDDALHAIEAELGSAEGEEAPALARRAVALADELRIVLDVPERPSPDDDLPPYDDEDDARAAPTYVHYTETQGQRRVLVARPVEVGSLFAHVFADMPALFVSATLSVGKSFAFARQRLGLDEVRELVVDSPFDFARQAAVYLPTDLPSPEAPAFLEAAAERAADLAEASGGGAFVLCTSHRALSIMRARIAARGMTVLTQGEAPKGVLLERFRDHGDAVLVATMSFWQGVDVPGRALRLVVIDKLPFASPTDPLVAARIEHLKARGRDAFGTYQLPQAILLLRQGFGRLIRRRDDRGVVAILDRRLHERRYGAQVLASLPPSPRLDDVAAVGMFIRGAVSPTNPKERPKRRPRRRSRASR
jgi:ATP-dependent DNA helicase DinG